jgi:hypothetical protein
VFSSSAATNSNNRFEYEYEYRRCATEYEETSSGEEGASEEKTESRAAYEPRSLP